MDEQETVLKCCDLFMLLSCTVLLHETVLNVNKTVYFHCLSGKATTGKLKEFAKYFLVVQPFSTTT